MKCQLAFFIGLRLSATECTQMVGYTALPISEDNCISLPNGTAHLLMPGGACQGVPSTSLLSLSSLLFLSFLSFFSCTD